MLKHEIDHVVGGIGKEFRKAIFEDRRLSFNEG